MLFASLLSFFLFMFVSFAPAAGSLLLSTITVWALWPIPNPTAQARECKHSPPLPLLMGPKGARGPVISPHRALPRGYGTPLYRQGVSRAGWPLPENFHFRPVVSARPPPRPKRGAIATTTTMSTATGRAPMPPPPPTRGLRRTPSRRGRLHCSLAKP